MDPERFDFAFDPRDRPLLALPPVRSIDPPGLVRHPGLTVTVTDPEGLARLLA